MDILTGWHCDSTDFNGSSLTISTSPGVNPEEEKIRHDKTGCPLPSFTSFEAVATFLQYYAHNQHAAELNSLQK